MNTTTPAAEMLAALNAWNADADDIYPASLSALVAVACRVLSAIPGVTAATEVGGSLGSTYIELDTDSEDGSIVKVRFSNHKAGMRRGENAWSFEPGETLESVEAGLRAIAVAVADARN